MRIRSMRRRFVLLTLLCSLGITAPMSGQVAARQLHEPTVAVRLKDGSLLVGLLVDQAPDSVRIVTSAGRMTLARSAIAELKVINPAEIHDGSYWPADPQDRKSVL